VTDVGEELPAVDEEALERAISLTLSENDRDRVEQVQAKLRDEPRFEVGCFCAYVRQTDALKLMPWEIPPCWIEEEDIPAILAAGSMDARYNAAVMGQRLLASKRSLFEPSPLTALGDAKS
jgi:hypothetical protein